MDPRVTCLPAGRSPRMTFLEENMKTAEVIIDYSEKNVDLYYATRFLAPDSYTFFQIDGKKYLLLSDLEIDRAKKDATVDDVLSLTKYLTKAKENGNPNNLEALSICLNELGVKKLIVPNSMPFIYVDFFRDRGFELEGRSNPFFSKRFHKTKEELGFIKDSQTAVFSAMKLAEDMIKMSAVQNGVLYLDDKPLTSDRVRDAIETHLFNAGCITGGDTIVAGGEDAIDPHCIGSGELRANEAIIVDIFPKSIKTRFYGDATRTFCKGEASDKLKDMYNTVLTAQENAIKKIKAGINGKDIHNEIMSYFVEKGYPTGEKDGRMQGFFHATGHGIGLEIHEEPCRIKPGDYTLEEGFVMSVEPGLYYKDIGGVRIEDLIYITKEDCKIIGSYPKKLEI